MNCAVVGFRARALEFAAVSVWRRHLTDPLNESGGLCKGDLVALGFYCRLRPASVGPVLWSEWACESVAVCV